MAINTSCVSFCLPELYDKLILHHLVMSHINTPNLVANIQSAASWGPLQRSLQLLLLKL